MQTTEARRATPAWLRPVYFTFGLLSLAVAVAGVVLPLVPTTGPLLLAAFFFARSSDRFHTWLVTHPRFGPLIDDYRSGRGIPRWTKVWALAAMTVAFTAAVLIFTSHIAVKVAVGAIGIAAIGYVAGIPVAGD